MIEKQKNDVILDLVEAMRFREANPLIPDRNECILKVPSSQNH
jgi:hypothetical protein